MEIVNRQDFIVKHGGKAIVFLLSVLILMVPITLIIASNFGVSCQDSELDGSNVKINKSYPGRNNTKTLIIKVEEQIGMKPSGQNLPQKSKCKKADKSFKRLGDNIRGTKYFPFISRIEKLKNLYKPEQENVLISHALSSFIVQLYENIGRNENNQEALHMHQNLLSQFKTLLKDIKEESVKTSRKGANISQVLYDDLERYQSDLHTVELNYSKCNENRGKKAETPGITISLDTNIGRKTSYYQYFMKLQKTIEVIKFDVTSRLKCEYPD